MFEHPLPPGTYGIVLSWGNKPEIDILDKEVTIYSNSFPGDPVTRRLAAVLSVEDARKLMLKLSDINGMTFTANLQAIPQQERNFNPDNFPPARIILDPDIVVSNFHPEEIEYPFPSGSEGLRLPLAIRGISPFSGEKVPMLLCSRDEAINLYGQLQNVLGKFSFRGETAISVEKEFISPKRLVRFENNQFIPEEIYGFPIKPDRDLRQT